MATNGNDSFLMLILDVDGCRAEARLNDILVASAGLDDAESEMVPVNHFALPGRNLVQLTIAEIPGRPLASATATLGVTEMPAGAFPGDERNRVIASVDWSHQTTEGAQGLHASGGFDFSTDVPAWSWVAADPQQHHDASLDELFPMITRLSDALGRGDPEPYISLARIRFEEVSTAFKVDPSSRIAAFREIVANAAAVPGFRMQSIVRDNLVPQVQADGRLVEIMGRDGLPCIRAERQENGSIPIRFPTRFAKIANRWHIVR